MSDQGGVLCEQGVNRVRTGCCLLRAGCVREARLRVAAGGCFLILCSRARHSQQSDMSGSVRCDTPVHTLFTPL